jgi:hypothetical protein
MEKSDYDDFHMDGSTALIAGTEQWPNDQTKAAKWDRCNLTTLGLIWASTHVNFLVKEETSGSACFAKLKIKFKSRSFAH